MGTVSKEIHFLWRVEDESKHTKFTILVNIPKITSSVSADSLNSWSSVSPAPVEWVRI